VVAGSSPVRHPLEVEGDAKGRVRGPSRNRG
jgi:hypothetical protein